MKNIFQSLLRISAIGIMVPIVYCLVITSLRHAFGFFSMAYPLWREAIDQSIVEITLVSIVLALLVIYQQRKAMPTPDKRFRIMTYITAGLLLLGIIIGALTFPVIYGGWCLIYIPLWMRLIEAIALFVWLWMLSNRTGTEPLAKPVANLALSGVILILLLLVLMVVATIYVLIHGHVYGFGTFVYSQWLSILVPLITIGSYALSIKRTK